MEPAKITSEPQTELAYTPYKAPPPRSSLVRGGKYSGAKTVIEEVVTNRADHYDVIHEYANPLDNGSVAVVPPPKDTLEYMNHDPSLGGKMFHKPSPSGPMSDFNSAVAKTPMSSNFNRVIPWDHQRKDFCYGAVHDHIFRGRYDRRRLKNRMDRCKNLGGWDPVSGYNCCYVLGLILILIIILLWIILFFFGPANWTWDRFWMWWVFLPLLLIFLIIVLICAVKASSNHSSRNRARYIRQACEDINARHLRGSGVNMRSGDKGGWLEVGMDPARTDVRGNVIEDRRVWEGEEEKVRVLQEEGKYRDQFASKRTIPIETRPKKQLVEEVVEYQNAPKSSAIVKEETIVNSGPTEVYQSNYVTRTAAPVKSSTTTTSVVSGGSSSKSAKKQAFYERLQRSKREKMSRSRSPSEMMSVNYSSNVPAQRSPGRSLRTSMVKGSGLNLMAKK